MLKTALRALVLGAALLGFQPAPASAAGGHAAPPLPSEKWSFGGLFGTFDRASAQRGFQVYKEVCSACHSLDHMAYRHLGGAGGAKGLGFKEEDIKAIAAENKVKDGPNDDGDMFDRPGRPSDKFVRPFPNEKAARAANGGALPPDLSLIAKARPGGADYVYGLLMGYEDAPHGFTVPDGMNYNKYFPGQLIAMVAPISDDSVSYADGTKATKEQIARDVTTFLAWAAEPEMEDRKRMGLKVILFLFVLSAMLYAVKRKIWAAVH